MSILLTGTEFCNNTAGIWSLLGIAITAIKVVIPVMLIIFGMLDFGKAVTSGKEDEIKKQMITFIKRAIAAVVVFFVPTIVGMLMQMVQSSVKDANDICGYSVCIKNATGVTGGCAN